MKNRKTADQPESACASNNLVEMKFSRQPLIDNKPAPTIFTDYHGRRNMMRIAAVLANGLSIEASALFLVDEEGFEALNGQCWITQHNYTEAQMAVTVVCRVAIPTLCTKTFQP